MTGPTPEERRDIEMLLPFYVNGSLDDAERARVDAAREADDGIDREIAFLEALRTGIRAAEGETANQTNSPGEFGLKRLERDRRAVAQPGQTAPLPGETVPMRPGLIQRGAWRPMALAASLALVIGFGAANLIAPGGDTYQAAGDGAVSLAGPVIQISFVPTTSERAIRAVLRQNKLSIISGPSALGIYRVAIRGGKRSDVKKIIANLTARRDVIAEAVGE